MKKITYPLLYFELKEDAVLGLLVGAGYEVIESDLAQVKRSMLSYLQKQYKKSEIYPYMDILEPKLKVLEVPIRPAFREPTGSYPMPYTVKAPVPVVYGQTEEGYYECYLPLFEANFYYYDPKQFESLAQYFSTNLLNQMPPEKLYRLLMYKKPNLDTISLRVKSDSDRGWIDFNFQRQFRTLTRLAERFPYTKIQRKNITAYPEAAWELEDKVSEIIDKLISTRSNVLVVGKHGVGKSAALQQAIRKISGPGGKQKLDFSFWRIMPQRITATAKYLGEWQETCEDLIEELGAANGILWVIDIVRLLQTGGEGPEDSVAAFLQSFLQQNKLQLIGEATPQELESMRRLLPAFVQNFQIIQIDELPEKKIQSILQKFSDFSRQNLKIPIDSDALSLAYRLLLRYFPYEGFPGKGLKFLGQCISEAQINESNKVDRDAVITNFIQQTGLPELFLRDEILLDTNGLYAHFESQIIGQPAAVEKLCSIVKVFKAGLNNPYKPISTLIFAGPTGVGKTASAKALANYFFGKGQRRNPLVRIDMSEFQHPSQITRFIGAGNEAGHLVREIRERPFSVLLLDEIEKADPSIFDALMTVIDEGIMVDAFGRVTDFRNCIIIMTSNLGAGNQQAIGFQAGAGEEGRFLSAIEKHFRPEFFNRIDGVVMFQPLTREHIVKITKKELEELKQREGFAKRGLRLQFSEAVVNQLVQVGFDERYGARPLQRAIEQGLVNPIANWLLENPKAKNKKLTIDFVKGELVIV
jgi:ATP-dependent Clp protease ATP-binding subunit ClpC